MPVIGCTCPVCTSADPRNKRTRPSILVTAPSGANILVDTSPEMRLQLLANGVRRLDAILYTHSHADHIFGLDDIRSFNIRQNHAVPVYAEPDVEADLRRVYAYIFRPTPVGGGKPQIDLYGAAPLKLLTLGGLDILPLRVLHGRLPILAFKFGRRAAYVTDVSEIPDETWPHLLGLDLLILDAVRRKPHETHFHLAAALDVVRRLSPQRTLLTHLSHDYDQDTVNEELPNGVELAYDTQKIEVSEPETALSR
ncbi:MAG: MBL fold metallo-hydrolase [Capsulimonadaceae bacterium]